MRQASAKQVEKHGKQIVYAEALFGQFKSAFLGGKIKVTITSCYVNWSGTLI